MRTLTATEASRGFSALLDSIIRDDGDVTITRGGLPVARIVAAESHTFGNFLREMGDLIPTEPRTDDGWANETADMRASLSEPEDLWDGGYN